MHDPVHRRRFSLTQGWSGEIVYPTLALFAVLALWEAVVLAAKVPRYLLPRPSEIVVAMVYQSPVLLRESLVTLQEIVIGFVLSVIVAVPLAVLIVSSRPFEKSFYPLLVASQVIPKVAIAPLFLVWFGFGLLPKVLIVFLIAFFPIVINSVIGLRSMEIEKHYLAQSMGANRWQVFAKLQLPNALPSMFGGLKVAATLSVIGAIVGEFVGSDDGIGSILMAAIGSVDTVTLFAGVGYLSIMGILIFVLMDVLERLLIPWHTSRRMERIQSS